MAKFGLFEGGHVRPKNQFEGDYMAGDGDFVTIYKRSGNPTVQDTVVVRLKLDKNHFVQLLND